MWIMKHGIGPIPATELMYKPEGFWCVYKRYDNDNKLQAAMRAYATTNGARIECVSYTSIDQHGAPAFWLKVQITKTGDKK